MNSTAIGKYNVKTDNLVHRKTPVTRSIAVATVGKVPTNADTGAGSVGQSTLALVVDALGQVTQPETTADLGNALVVEADILELLEVDDQAAILAARGVRSVRVAPALGLNLDTILGRAENSIRDVLDGGRDDNDGRGVGDVHVVGLSEIGEVGV